MNPNRLSVLIILILLIFLRIQSEGGLRRFDIDYDLKNLGSKFEDTRFFLSKRIAQILPQPQAGLLSGMLLGVKEDLPLEFDGNLRKTSTIHIVVVSGQNLTLVAGFLLTLAPFLGRRKTILASFSGVIFYAMLTGLQVPVIRAAIMFLFASGASLLGREKEGWWVLILTALGMLIYNPNWLLSISFQLSFLATIGVVIVAPVLIAKLKKFPEFLKEDFSVSLCAQALTLPIIASNFHNLSLIGILVNTLILWTIPVIMITGFITLLGAVIDPALGQILALVPGIFLTYFVYVVDIFGKLSFASTEVGDFGVILWIGYYLVLIALFLHLKKGVKVQDKSLELMRKGG